MTHRARRVAATCAASTRDDRAGLHSDLAARRTLATVSRERRPRRAVDPRPPPPARSPAASRRTCPRRSWPPAPGSRTSARSPSAWRWAARCGASSSSASPASSASCASASPSSRRCTSSPTAARRRSASWPRRSAARRRRPAGSSTGWSGGGWSSAAEEPEDRRQRTLRLTPARPGHPAGRRPRPRGAVPVRGPADADRRAGARGDGRRGARDPRDHPARPAHPGDPRVAIGREAVRTLKEGRRHGLRSASAELHTRASQHRHDRRHRGATLRADASAPRRRPTHDPERELGDRARSIVCTTLRRGGPWSRPTPAIRDRRCAAPEPRARSAAEAADHVVEDRQAPAQRVERDPLVDAVEALEEALVGVEPERARSRRSACPRLGGVLGVGRERGHDRERDAVGVVVADGRHRGGRTAGPRPAPRPAAPHDDELDVAGGSELRRRARSTLGPHLRLGRARQDAAVDLDDRVARDDVVLDAGVDDVRADRVAQQRAERPARTSGRTAPSRAASARRGSSPAERRAGPRRARPAASAAATLEEARP